MVLHFLDLNHYQENLTIMKKVILNTVRASIKYFGLAIGGILVVILTAGLSLRFFGPKAQLPGKLVDVGGFKLHVNSVGIKNDKPTLVIESGAGAFSEYYYWLGEGLKDSMRIVRYDRAGIGYSELSDGARDPETIAKELHTLLEVSGESPPYLMAGHSYGGHYIRVFAQMYPSEVAGLVFLDAPHPDESKRLNTPPTPDFIRTLYWIGAVLGDLGIIDLFVRTIQPILIAPGLPDQVTNRFKDYSINGKYLWGYLEEEIWHNELVDRSRRIDDFGDLPIKVFAGTHLNEELVRNRGMDPDFIRSERKNMQSEMAKMSTQGEVFFMNGGHFFFIDKAEADFVCKEILKMIK